MTLRKANIVANFSLAVSFLASSAVRLLAATMMFRLDSSAFLSFVFFHKLRECYTEEATSAS